MGINFKGCLDDPKGIIVLAHQRKVSGFCLFICIFCFLGKVKTRYSSKKNCSKAVFVTLTSFYCHDVNNKQDV